MKKVLTIILLLTVFIGVKAQSSDYNCSFQKDYTYGFFSNWSIGGGIVGTKSLGNDCWHFRNGTNFGVDARLNKQIGQHWDLRFVFDIPGLFITKDYSECPAFDRYGKGMVGFSWTPKNHFYIFGDAGVNAKLQSIDSSHHVGVAADAGLGLKYRLSCHSTVFGELGADIIGKVTSTDDLCHAYLKLGYLYNFGPTKADRAILAARELVANDRLADSVARLKRTIKNDKDTISDLVNRLSILEDHDSVLHDELSKAEEVNDSLSYLLSDFKKNRYNAYALPFSVLFDNDSYTIKSNQMEKIKAVAEFMKSDTLAHYDVVGFCDYTGSTEYNKKLSEKRANAVKKELVKRGVSESQISVSYFGKDMPFADEKFPVNRRVSFYRTLFF